MDFIGSLIQQYGTFYAYIIVFLGSLVEGESVILSASALSYMGHLNIYTIMVIAFLGTWIADQALYMLGRKKGAVIFERFPKLKASSERAFKLLHKWDAWFIILCRFIYGIRVTSSIVVGAAGISPQRFIPLNTLSALVWTVISCLGGYALGPVVIVIFEYFNKIQQYIFLFAGLVFLVWIFKKIKKKS